MLFENGFPRIQGASDFADSSHLAGILAIFNHPQAVDCTKYAKGNRYVRHTSEYMYDFSRDQATLLMAGLIAQSRNDYVGLKYIDGKDILPPSVRGLESIAKSGKASWLSHQWLKGEIWWHSNLQPLEECFQVIALCISYDKAHKTSYLKSWVQQNKLWKWSVKRYLCELDGAWRDEKDLAEFVIDKIKEMTK